ncbi:G-type lectin S-receptor-like serine/threonine-protein kinase [Hibiscus syriacus]|uniref:Receptor-like serine/threonine-protein kinase n=1 Tax=Hibiscus syriacus TaxID=106335 RepID=A0A6A2YY37_HIBSY|nr:G-type lectin S-receptor-like serine/threonine-protein kinase [Hibiscus syriacus]
MDLTGEGISVTGSDGVLKWSTPELQATVRALTLTDMGNLVLLDQSNGSLWESFDYPTDTIVFGQRLYVGANLSNAASGSNLSTGDYRFMVTGSDAILQWHQQTYWKLSMDTKAYMNSNDVVEYMAINETGLYLLGRNGSVVVIRVNLSTTSFRIAKLGVSASQNIGGCLPDNPSYSLPIACDSTNNVTVTKSNSSDISYMKLGSGMEYFSLIYSHPEINGVKYSSCQDLCSDDCACLGIFYDNSSGSCYVLQNELGSIILSDTVEDDLQGYVKVLVGPTSTDSNGGNGDSNGSKNFPTAAVVLLPFTGVFLLAALVFLWWKRCKFNKSEEMKLGHQNSVASDDLGGFSIPGLPQKFNYEELELATDNFKTQIGAGGFGVVYKGTLPDKTVVAVKKITNPGNQGKKEFCTEIAVIGNVHHVNLVKLRGFCAHGRQRFLVYEYMNRGSLDRSLFSNGPALAWQERFDIALGTARGLAYLHGGCEHKIIHCDVKPENILLHNHFQVKISDFGLSKLLTPEQSSLFTTMRGTRGYLAPEWLTNSAISEKTDVYSFGMVLLELVSGRKKLLVEIKRPYNQRNQQWWSQQSSSSSVMRLVYFPLFALQMHEQGRYMELADPRLEGRVNNEEVEKLVRTALCCVHEEPVLRPSMATVVGMLEGGLPLSQPRVESLNFLRFYGRRFTEASMVDEENRQSDDDFMLFQQENASIFTSGSNTCFSYMSSQQISGPNNEPIKISLPTESQKSMKSLKIRRLEDRIHLYNLPLSGGEDPGNFLMAYVEGAKMEFLAVLEPTMDCRRVRGEFQWKPPVTSQPE